jgi:hypothetical protein
VEGGRQLRRIAVQPLPFRVGRLPDLALTLASDSVSKEHGELFLRSGALHVRDLGSKNGTFVNSERVGEAPLREGDILHFAQVEFRVGRQEIDSGEDLGPEPSTVSLGDMKLPEQFVEGTRDLPELLRERQVTTVFQPIVSLPSGTLAGYEALGRGRHPRLPEAPLDLFRIAAGVGAEAELSQLFREMALELVLVRTGSGAIHNVPPSSRRGLVPRPFCRNFSCGDAQCTARSPTWSIDRLRAQLSRAGWDRMWRLRRRAGAAPELAEVPPHYLKFDMLFVRGIDKAPETRQRLLTSLVSVARDLLVYTVAEGVETAEEAEVCMRIGFTHAQGFFFGSRNR